MSNKQTVKNDYTLLELYVEALKTINTIKYQSKLWQDHDVPYSTKLFLKGIISVCDTFLEKAKTP